jgi:hypothetical protein
MVRRSDLGHITGRDPWVFWLFLALFVAGELRPLAWLSGREGGPLCQPDVRQFQLLIR